MINSLRKILKSGITESKGVNISRFLTHNDFKKVCSNSHPTMNLYKFQGDPTFTNTDYFYSFN